MREPLDHSRTSAEEGLYRLSEGCMQVIGGSHKCISRYPSFSSRNQGRNAPTGGGGGG